MSSKQGVGRPRIDLSDPDAAKLAAWLGKRFRRAEKLRTEKGIAGARPQYGLRTIDMVKYLREKKIGEKKAYKCIEAAWRTGIIRRKLEPPKGSYLRGRPLPTVNKAGKIVVPIVGRPLRGWWVIRDWYSVPVGPRGFPLDVDVNVPRPLSEEPHAALKWTLSQELGEAVDQWLRKPATGALRGLDLEILVEVDIKRSVAPGGRT